MRQLTFVTTGVLEWWEVPEPVLHGGTDAIVRPLAVATCDLDPYTIRGQTPFSMTAPFAFGHEFTAEVIDVGDAVSAFRPGDRVVVSFQICCGSCAACIAGVTASCQSVEKRSMYGFGPIGGEWGGALSDLVRVPFADFMLASLPAGVAPEVAAAAGDNLCDALRCVAPVKEQPGIDVLLLGSSPSCLSAIEIAKAFGAARVAYADADPRRLAVAERLGAQPIEVDRWPHSLGSYPVTASGVFDPDGDPAGLSCALRSTTPGGVCTNAAPFFPSSTTLPLLDMYLDGITFVTGRVNACAHMAEVLELIASGQLHPTEVISRIVDWDDAIDGLVEERGKVVVVR